MSNQPMPSFLTIPAEIVCRILNNLSDYTLTCSMKNICQRLNGILENYPRYQVNIFFIRIICTEQLLTSISSC